MSTIIKTTAGATEETFKVAAALFCPYHNADERGLGSVDYYRKEAFVHNPFTLPAKGCSGSPIIRDREGRFFGFLNPDTVEGSEFSYDGKGVLTVKIPEGQELLVSDVAGDADVVWREYNREVMKRLDYKPQTEVPDFWKLPEYCTWVEQKYTAQLAGPGQRAQEHLDAASVRAYVDGLDRLGYPKGKVTLDHGWNADSLKSGFGSWLPREDKFPDMRATADYIKNAGHVAGLWIGFPKIHRESTAAQKHPELVGEEFATFSENGRDVMHYLKDTPVMDEYSEEVIRRFYDMGFMKFKIDMSYHRKHLMRPIHRSLYNAAKAIDPEIEMEFHVPDIFLAQYSDVIRTNDVWVTDDLPWWQLTRVRYEICRKCAPGRVINRDHVGGNDCRNLTPEQYLDHLDTYRKGIGYPLISMLPDHFGQEVATAVGEVLENYMNGPRTAISDFY